MSPDPQTYRTIPAWEHFPTELNGTSWTIEDRRGMSFIHMGLSEHSMALNLLLNHHFPIIWEVFSTFKHSQPFVPYHQSRKAVHGSSPCTELRYALQVKRHGVVEVAAKQAFRRALKQQQVCFCPEVFNKAPKSHAWLSDCAFKCNFIILNHMAMAIYVRLSCVSIRCVSWESLIWATAEPNKLIISHRFNPAQKQVGTTHY